MLYRAFRNTELRGNGGIPVYEQLLELYDLERDPGERVNLAGRMGDVVERLKGLAMGYHRQVVPPRFLGRQTVQKVAKIELKFCVQSFF